jgi:protein ImuA
MRASVFMAEGGFARLRRRITEIEARRTAVIDGETTPLGSAVDGASRPVLSPRRAGSALPFSIPKIDRLLAGGLRRNALHELRCAESRNTATATGFAAALLSRLMAQDDRPILWIVETPAAHEAGFIYGHGLGRFGVDPRRLIIVRLKAAREALWVFEEGLCCRGLAAVVTEIHGHPSVLDLTASRRLALRAREHGVMGILLRQTGIVAPGAATTRWLVAPRPAAAHVDDPDGIGRPAWRLTLERNRTGATGTFDVEWDHDRQNFALPAAVPAGPAHPLRIASPPRDRPAASPHMGKVVALRPLRKEQRELPPREIRRRHARAR